MSKDRLNAWIEADLPTDEESLKKFGITNGDLKKLEKRVMKAVAAKLLESPDVMVFSDHRTLQ